MNLKLNEEGERTAKKPGKGKKPRSGGSGQRGGPSLTDLVREILTKAGGPVPYRDIVAGARKAWKKAGKAEAKSFSGQVWHSANDAGKLVPGKRGVYVLRPAGSKPAASKAKATPRKSGRKQAPKRGKKPVAEPTAEPEEPEEEPSEESPEEAGTGA